MELLVRCCEVKGNKRLEDMLVQEMTQVQDGNSNFTDYFPVRAKHAVVYCLQQSITQWKTVN